MVFTLCYKTFIVDRIEKNIKSKLFDLYKEKEWLSEFNNGKKVWMKSTGGLSLKELTTKNYIEIEILESMLL